MEEKERYELFGEHCIKDNNPDARCQLLDAYLACVILNEQDKENHQLKQQLAEKERQVKKLNNETQKYIEDAYCNDFHNQDKISFAIAKLEKVKENIKKVPITDFDLSGNFEKMYKQDAIRQIDNQIKQLKGENNEIF